VFLFLFLFLFLHVQEVALCRTSTVDSSCCLSANMFRFTSGVELSFKMRFTFVGGYYRKMYFVVLTNTCHLPFVTIILPLWHLVPLQDTRVFVVAINDFISVVHNLIGLKSSLQLIPDATLKTSNWHLGWQGTVLPPTENAHPH
jgi:hypothetical protein